MGTYYQLDALKARIAEFVARSTLDAQTRSFLTALVVSLDEADDAISEAAHYDQMEAAERASLD